MSQQQRQQPPFHSIYTSPPSYAIYTKPHASPFAVMPLRVTNSDLPTTTVTGTSSALASTPGLTLHNRSYQLPRSGPLPRRSGAVKAPRRKSWTPHPLAPQPPHPHPHLNIHIPSFTPIDLDNNEEITPVPTSAATKASTNTTTSPSRRHSDPTSASTDPWTEVYNPFSPNEDGEGFKEVVALMPAPLQLRPMVVSAAQPPLQQSSARGPDFGSFRPPHPQSPPDRIISFAQAPGTQTRNSRSEGRKEEKENQKEEEDAIYVPPPVPAELLFPPSNPISSPSTTPTPDPHPSTPDLKVAEPTTFEDILHRRTIHPSRGPSYVIHPPSYSKQDGGESETPAVAFELRDRLDEVLRNWGEGTSPAT